MSRLSVQGSTHRAGVLLQPCQWQQELDVAATRCGQILAHARASVCRGAFVVMLWHTTASALHSLGRIWTAHRARAGLGAAPAPAPQVAKVFKPPPKVEEPSSSSEDEAVDYTNVPAHLMQYVVGATTLLKKAKPTAFHKQFCKPKPAQNRDHSGFPSAGGTPLTPPPFADNAVVRCWP